MILTGENIIRLNETGSTNNYAKQLVLDEVEEGTVVLAQFQAAGRGQAGNYWESEAGKNLLCSLILYPKFLNAGAQFLVSKVVSLSLAEWLETESDDVSVKWPNDLYVANKKIAGILIENSVKGMRLDSSVIGFGLNLNQEVFRSDAPNPVSLKQITGKKYEVEEVLNQLLGFFSKWFSALENGKVQRIGEAYFSKLLGAAQWRTFRKDGEDFDARIVGIGEYGHLQLETRAGKISDFMFKEVEFVF